ncbi:hypothetical protein ScalyP_jg669 [Parmales sp. scaly parma]|nr:hypothetical protein ScalyP_jg669 [Parmales sp. scaly parma]
MSGFPITYAIEPQCLSFADLTINTIYLIQDGKKTKNRAKLLGKDSNSQQVHIKWIDAGWEKWYEFEIGKIELDVLNNSLHSYAPRSCNTHSTKKLHETEVKVKSEPIDDEERDSDEEKLFNNIHKSPSKLFTLNDFNIIWKIAEQKLDVQTTALEDSQLIKKGNHGDGGLGRRQYGRVLPAGMDAIFDFTFLQEGDIFLDLGSGIGNAPIQAALTKGAKGRGIEIMQARASIGAAFKGAATDIVNQITPRPPIGEVDLMQGDFSSFGSANQTQLDYITTADVILVNNFNGIFAERSGLKITPNSRIAPLFAQMKPGARLVCMDRITELGNSRSAMNVERKKKDLRPSFKSTFFETAEFTLPSGSVSWGNKTIDITIYTRVVQWPGIGINESATFCCGNGKCQSSSQSAVVPIENDELGRFVMNLRCNQCNWEPSKPRDAKTKEI